MPGSLAGIRVLNFTWALAGPFGTMILAVPNRPVKYSRTPAEVERPAPESGEHSGPLRLAEQDVAALEAEGVIRRLPADEPQIRRAAP